jgi:hypothetical protein
VDPENESARLIYPQNSISRVTINEEWHRKNRMPRNPTVEQRIEWHLEHQKNCSCRPIPRKLSEEMERRGIEI